MEGTVTGGILGVALGAVVGAALFGPSGSATGAVLTMGAIGAVGGAGGYVLMDKASAFAGEVGRGLDEANPERGEAIGRTALNAGLSLLGGNWRGAAFQTVVALGGGGVAYALAGKDA
ncbi:MAG: hypothetical protein AB1758_14115 [Candidatus Eremiobacterota bacterium]